MTKFSQVEDFAKKFNWIIAPEILADKMGMDLVISIDDAVDSIMNIGKKAPDLRRRLRLEYYTKPNSFYDNSNH